jgi:hypothetical protein
MTSPTITTALGVFSLRVIPPQVNDIDTPIIIEARNIKTEELYRGCTNGWESCIVSDDIYKMCVDGCAGTNANSRITTVSDLDKNTITLKFHISTYAISTMRFDAKLELVKPISSQELREKMFELRERSQICIENMESITECLDSLLKINY